SPGNVEVIIYLIIDPCLDVYINLIATCSWSDTALRVDTLDVRHARKRTNSFVRSCFEQQPRNRAGPWSIGFLQNFADDFAAIIRFPSGSAIILPNFLSFFVYQISFKRFETPLEFSRIRGCCLAD